MNPDANNNSDRRYYLRTRREAAVAGLIWLVFLVWTVGVSYWLGYVHNDFSTVMGLPTWIFWGVLVPFGAATLANSLYAFFYLEDDPQQ
ncbi:DUF997 family protein [Halomonas borealis]|jgi:hypothetical protein|uniref:DUF997 family protein n=1 Tax=Halomonas borealis TaxID=2508710 RepID=UPI00109F8A3C|nr:DUF997 family protein [Halomonas borealis]